MLVAAARIPERILSTDRVMLTRIAKCIYNIGLRRLKPYIPEYPIGDLEDVAYELGDFIPHSPDCPRSS